MKLFINIIFLFVSFNALAQETLLRGFVKNNNEPVEAATVIINGVKTVLTDSAGHFSFTGNEGVYTIKITAIGFEALHQKKAFKKEPVVFTLQQNQNSLLEVVVTGTMKEVSKAASPVPVEVYNHSFFKKLSPPNLFEAIGMVNGIRPQLNCNICNTGDIHINGMEGPYTQVLIDGMPIVSGLATVYGLMGIPLSMIERVEVIKGPAASLYGSEAMGGTINVITKNPSKSPLVSADVNASTYGELNLDAGIKIKHKKHHGILGINYFSYNQRIDKNNDGFTDITLQNRISIFNKWNIQRKENRILQMGARLYVEDRWGGQTNWNKEWMGGDSIYGETINTNRFEWFGTYELPVREKMFLNWSYNSHIQKSFYGTTSYDATQHIAFLQWHWTKQIAPKHNFLVGSAIRYTIYDDNTTATITQQKTVLPGIFIQDEYEWNKNNTLLAGLRFDYNNIHGAVFSPRLALKLQPQKNHTIRASMGSGFRVVNIFSEDHAALTGARDVLIAEDLKPEQSVNSVLNWQWTIPVNNGSAYIEANAFYSYYFNKIIPDYLTDPNKIIYQNLKGNGIGQGISVNAEYNRHQSFKVNAGISYMDVFQNEKDVNGKKIKNKQMQAPEWSGTFSISKKINGPQITIDFTGNWYGPMRLPILPNDYRPEYSPWFCLANVQATKKFNNGIELYTGVKNIFNFIPSNPIMRPFDPFDKQANDPVSNPNGYTFDPSYNYAPLQTARAYIGFRYLLNK